MDHTFHGRRSCMARHTVRHRAYPVVPNWSPSPDPVAPGGRVLVERPVPDADAGGLHLRDEVLHRPHDEGAPEQGRGIASKGSSTEPRPPPDPGPETGRDRARRALTSHRPATGASGRVPTTSPMPHAPCARASIDGDRGDAEGSASDADGGQSPTRALRLANHSAQPHSRPHPGGAQPTTRCNMTQTSSGSGSRRGSGRYADAAFRSHSLVVRT